MNWNTLLKINENSIFLIDDIEFSSETVLGISLRKVSYEAFVFSVFSRNQEKTKPLTWQSVSSEALPSL